MKIEVVTIYEEIKVIGLSYRKLGLPETIESINKMWSIYGEEYRGKISNAVEPLMDYGVNADLPTVKDEYIAGCAVTEIGDLDENWESFIIPPGKYIKHTRNKIDDLFTYADDVWEWAELNHIKLGDGCMVEVYPMGAFDNSGAEVYTLRPVQL